jgi:hypothetical protein
MMRQQFHNDSTTIPHDSRIPEGMPAKMRASPPLATTRKLRKSTNSPYFGQVAVVIINQFLIEELQLWGVG